MKPVIEVRNLTKRFGNFTAVNDISFDVAKGNLCPAGDKRRRENHSDENALRIEFSFLGQRYGSRF